MRSQISFDNQSTLVDLSMELGWQPNEYLSFYFLWSTCFIIPYVVEKYNYKSVKEYKLQKIIKFKIYI